MCAASDRSFGQGTDRTQMNPSLVVLTCLSLPFASSFDGTSHASHLTLHTFALHFAHFAPVTPPLSLSLSSFSQPQRSIGTLFIVLLAILVWSLSHLLRLSLSLSLSTVHLGRLYPTSGICLLANPEDFRECSRTGIRRSPSATRRCSSFFLSSFPFAPVRPLITPFASATERCLLTCPVQHHSNPPSPFPHFPHLSLKETHHLTWIWR